MPLETHAARVRPSEIDLPGLVQYVKKAVTPLELLRLRASIDTEKEKEKRVKPSLTKTDRPAWKHGSNIETLQGYTSSFRCIFVLTPTGQVDWQFGTARKKLISRRNGVVCCLLAPRDRLTCCIYSGWHGRTFRTDLYKASFCFNSNRARAMHIFRYIYIYNFETTSMVI